MTKFWDRSNSWESTGKDREKDKKHQGRRIIELSCSKEEHRYKNKLNIQEIKITTENNKN